MARRRRHPLPDHSPGADTRAKVQESLRTGLAQRLQWARDERDLKQYWVAEEAGLDPARYNLIENGNCGRIYIDEVVPVAGVLGCDLNWLLRGGNLDPWLPGTAPTRGYRGLTMVARSPACGQWEGCMRPW